MAAAISANEIVLFAAAFVGTLVVSAGATLLVLVRLPADYFTVAQRPHFATAHPVLRWTLIVLKNVAGWLVIALGLAMSVPGVPGQGLLTVFIGLMLVDFPGKYRLERALIRRPRIARGVNWVRARFDRPPLAVP